MSTPTQKHTKSRKNIRRSAFSLKKIEIVSCPKCKKDVRKHTACGNCGSYAGKEVVKVRVPKALRKKQARDAKKQEKENKKADKKEVKKESKKEKK